MSRNPRPSRLLGVVMVAALLISGCGYQFAASGDMLPASAQTIYVERFGNQTRVTGINDELMRYIKDEIDLHRRLKVVDSPDAADLELSGEVRFALQTPTNFNSALEPTQYNQSIVLSAMLKDMHDKKTIWSTNNVSSGEHTPVVPQTTVATTPTFLQQNLRADDIANMTDIQTAQSQTASMQDLMMQRLAQHLYAQMADGF
ncbi:LPS assembly lipoprotein LptE [Candidatus Binatus sp.]|uniref:LPS assembly lipoprotein LptE n=2 Tax=Candidatus Binatus sp. TaxID=2811406 RepID=UPI003CC563A5